jgi:hypothetical protein
MRPTLALLAVLAVPQGRTAPAPDPINACLVVTKQDALDAVNEDLRDGKPAVAGRSIIRGAAASSCEYSGRGLHTVQVYVWRVQPAGVAQLARSFRNLCEMKEMGGLAGLGDGACWYSAARDEVQVLKGVTLVHLIVRKNGDATEALKSLAKSALTRLP